jgi:hypothetical protein
MFGNIVTPVSVMLKITLPAFVTLDRSTIILPLYMGGGWYWLIRLYRKIIVVYLAALYLIIP